MKPIIIGVIIGIVVGVSAIGGALAFFSIQQQTEEARISAELEEGYADIDKFLQYESEMNSIQYDECWSIDLGYPDQLLDSFKKLKDIVESQKLKTKAELENQIWMIDRGISNPNVEAIVEYRAELLKIEEKYIGTIHEENFKHTEYVCDNPDFYIIFDLLTEHYSSEQDTPKINKDSNWIGISYYDFDYDLDLDSKDMNEFTNISSDLVECVSQYSEGWCLENIESRIEKLCNKYHPPEDNCPETTIHDMKIWLYKRLS